MKQAKRNVRHDSRSTLLLIDVINHFEFPDGENILRQALAIASPLELLLQEFGASSIILSGLATNSCILCTAHDANMRHLKTIVPGDCCAARTAREHRQALDHIAAMADAKVVASSALRLGTLNG